MKIRVLVENTTKMDCPVEHGLSLYIETGAHHILFDTGQTELFAENAERFGVDLKKVDLCFLSHGHYDHGGGLKRFTEINQTARVYMSRHAFEPHYRGEDRYIGLNPAWLQDEDLQNRIIYTESMVEIAPGLTICGPGKDKLIDMGCDGQLLRENGVFKPEDFRHEHYLMVREAGRRILISGCSHQGIINIVDWFKPDVLIGGFHFMRMSLDEQMAGFGRRLAAYDTEYYTCHCTGTDQYEFLKSYIQKLHYISEGMEILI